MLTYNKDTFSEQYSQELAATCLYIASKIEEIYPPSID